jgi:glyoxylase-like metal-dependent hydrolase (beta-lactamase superfamily II)
MTSRSREFQTPQGDGDAQEVAARLADAGVYRLPVPTPFAVGDINAYLIAGEPLTLIDSGPNMATSRATLERLIAETGHTIEDVGVFVITHPHVDHLGLTAVLSNDSDADVACLDQSRSFIANLESEMTADASYAAALMGRHGIAADVVDALRSVAMFVRYFGASVEPTLSLVDDGEVMLGSRRLRTLHRPGHSTSDTVLHDPANRFLFSGDHLLSAVSSNALVGRALGAAADSERTRALVDYRRSLLATRELDVDLVLGGHGPVVVDHRALIDERLRQQDIRAGRILDLLQGEPRSAHEIALKIWNRVAITQAFLTLSEVLGHLDLLLDDGLVIQDDEGSVITFHAT